MENVALSEKVINEIKAGRKISAIKLLREEQGIGLKEAKVLIESHINQNAEVKEAFEANQPAGLSQERVLQLVVIIIVLLVVYYFYQKQ